MGERDGEQRFRNSDGDGGTVFVYNRLEGGGGEEKKVYVALLMS